MGGGRWELDAGHLGGLAGLASSFPASAPIAKTDMPAAIIGSARGSSPKCIVPDGPDWTNATGRCGGFGSAFKEPQGAREPVVATASLPRDGRSASGVLEFVRSRLKPLLPRRPQSHRVGLFVEPTFASCRAHRSNCSTATTATTATKATKATKATTATGIAPLRAYASAQ